MRIAPLIFLVLFSGCATARITKATALVWRDVYGVKYCSPPTIVFENASTCTDGWEEKRECVHGKYYTQKDVAVIVLKSEGPVPLSQLSFAHELFHAALFCLGYKEGDIDHTSADWYILPAAANRVLSGAGL